MPVTLLRVGEADMTRSPPQSVLVSVGFCCSPTFPIFS